MPDLASETALDLEGRLGLEPGALGTALIGLLGRLHVGLCIHEAADGRCLFANETMCSLVRRKPAQIVGHGVAEWLDAAPAADLQAGQGQLSANPTAGQQQTLSLTVDGEVRHFSIYQHRLAAVDRSAPRLFCSIWLESAGGRTPFTGCDSAGAARTVPDSISLLCPDGESGGVDRAPNPKPGRDRSVFDACFVREVELSLQEHREFAIASLGVDRFEPELARHGARADRAVARIVDRLLRVDCAKTDAILQLDGMRFIVLFSGVGLATAHSRAERLLRRCAAESVVIDGGVFCFTVSVGVASYPNTARDQRELIAAAAQAHQHAARRGGNQIALASISFEGH